MIVQTKFSLGDKVFPVARTTEYVKRDCVRCGGKGELALVEGGALPCPNRYAGQESCNGGQVTLGVLSPWQPSRDVGFVGKVSVIRYASRHANQYTHDGNEYMLDSTGVGSGRVWKEDDLFSTPEEAQTECDRRNADPSFAEDRANLLAGYDRRAAENAMDGAREAETAGAEA